MDTEQGCLRIPVPRDLLVELEALRAPSRQQRLLVSAWVMCWPRLVDREMLRWILELWPRSMLTDVRRPSVLGVLFQLEEWGVIEGVEAEGPFFMCRRGRAWPGAGDAS